MALTRPRLGQLITNTTSLTDNLTVINSAANQANVAVGFIFNRTDGVGSVPNVALYWNETTKSFTFATTTDSGDVAFSNVNASSWANITASNVIANTVSTNSLVYANGAPYNFTTYSNANVSTYLPSYAGALTASTITTTGNISAGGNITQTGYHQISYTPSTVTGAGIQAYGSGTQGGTTYFDFLKATNTVAGATNPTKWLRLDNAGTLQIINSAYTTNIFNLTDSGDFTVPGKITAGNLVTT